MSGAPPPAPRRSSRLPWIVLAAAVVLLIAVGGLVVALTGGDADSVEEVADQAVEAAEELDVDQGVDLLCEAPSATERDELEDLIAEGQDAAGTDEPDVSYAVSDVEGEASGSFVVSVTSDESGLEGRDVQVRVEIEEQDGRSCIAGFEDAEG